MSFNLLIDSKNNINQLNQSPNPLIIDPLLYNLYLFKPTYLSSNLLQNQGISRKYDLIIDPTLTLSEDGILTFPTTDTVGPLIVGDITFNTSFSIGCWLNINNVASNEVIFYSGFSSTTDRITVNVNTSGILTINIYVGTTQHVRTFQTILTDTWFHACFVINGSSWTVYLNGVAQTQTGVSITSGIARTLNYIGRGLTASNVNGSMSNFFLYNGALTSTQVNAIYDKGLYPNQSDYFYTIPIQNFTYNYANNQLRYYFDFNARPKHPYGTNKYKMYSSFISYGTATGLTNSNMLYYLIYGLGTENTFICRGGNPATTAPNNNLIKNITFDRVSQKWLDEDPLMPFIVENLNDTGIINVEIRFIASNQLSTDVLAWGAQANDYLIQLLFEPIE